MKISRLKLRQCGRRNLTQRYSLKNETASGTGESLMKALRIHQYGGSLQLDEVEKPVAGAGQVVIRTKATSFNPIDPGRASRVMRQMFPLELPWIPGGDVSGTVESIGEGVTDFKLGDEVFGYGMTGGAGGVGSLAIQIAHNAGAHVITTAQSK